MTYSVEQLTDLPIVVLRLHSDFDAETQLMSAFDASDGVVLSNDSRVYFICDATLAPKPTLKGLIEGANAVLRRPNIREVQLHIEEVMLIAPNKAMQVAATGLNSEAFGWLNIKIFATYDEALDYLRETFAESMRD